MVVTIKQQIKLVLWHSLCKWIWCIGSSVAVTQFHIQYFLSSQIIQYIITSKNPMTTSALCAATINDEHMKPTFTRKHRG